MKNSIAFPYKVITDSLQLNESAQDELFYEFKATLPDYIVQESKFRAVSNKLKFILEINCSATMYRKVFSSIDNHIVTAKVKKEKLFKKFSIDILIVANEDIFWQGQELSKGMPIAHLGSYNKNIDSRSSGLIVFEKNDIEKLKISFVDHTIKIKIPEKQFDYIDAKQNGLVMKQVLTSQFAQIALLEASRKLKENSSDYYLIWYQELLKYWRRFNPDEPYPKENQHFDFITDLLKNPSIELINLYIKLEKNN